MSFEAIVSEYDRSASTIAMARLLDELPLEEAHAELDRILDGMPVVDLAALENDWAAFWARPNQVPPTHHFETWGYLAGRGMGKTLTNSHYVNGEVEAGQAPLVCIIAQDEDNAVKLQITGPSGLIATAPPWFKPVWHSTDLELHWPNGARGYVRTPEVPGKIRGLEYHLSWCTEFQSWPKATMDEAWMNVLLSTRLGYSRIVWDATAKRRHALLRKLIKNAAADPRRNILVKGSTHENRLNLGVGYIKKLEEAIGGTQQGSEELHGEMSSEDEGALVKDAWIIHREQAGAIRRRVIGVDPAVTSRQGSDSTGIVDVALTADGKAAVLGDFTGKHTAEAWGTKVLDLYAKGRCDLVIVETNKGGDLCVRNLRACADERGVTVIVLGKTERAPGHVPGVVHVREVYGRGEKADRARPLATAYEKGRVVHVGKLEELEDTLTTWEPVPGVRSPDRLDPLVYAVIELLGLNVNEADPRDAFKGLDKLAEAARSPSIPRNLAALLGGGGGFDGGGRI